MISRRQHSNHVMTSIVRNAVVLGVSAPVMGWWWHETMHVGQP